MPIDWRGHLDSFLTQFCHLCISKAKRSLEDLNCHHHAKEIELYDSVQGHRNLGFRQAE